MLSEMLIFPSLSCAWSELLSLCTTLVSKSGAILPCPTVLQVRALLIHAFITFTSMKASTYSSLN